MRCGAAGLEVLPGPAAGRSGVRLQRAEGVTVSADGCRDGEGAAGPAGRLELAGEAMRGRWRRWPLPRGWLVGIIDVSWQQVYRQRIEEIQLPDSKAGLAGGGCPMTRCPVRLTMRRRSSGCTPGGTHRRVDHREPARRAVMPALAPLSGDEAARELHRNRYMRGVPIWAH
jgi:hypothetical protein